MKTEDLDHEKMLRLQTINECLRVQPVLCPPHSNGKPAVSSTTTKINVRFASVLSQELQIKRLTTNHMP